MNSLFSGSRRMGLALSLSAAVLLVFCAGPGLAAGHKDQQPAQFVFNLEGLGSMWDLPWPSDLQVRENGSINLEGMPTNLKTFRRLKEAVEYGYGFSTSPNIYFRFTKPLHQMYIPDALTTLKPGSPVLLMDVDPDSPERGRVFPLRVKFCPDKQALGFGPKNLLVIMPVPGFTLRENTTYAAVVMNTLRDINHQLLGSPLAFDQLKAGVRPPAALGGKALAIYGPAFDCLREKGVNIARIAAASVFTTGRPTARMQQLFAGVSELDLPTFSEPLARTREYDDYYVLEGALMMPQFQDGTPPYGRGEGGRLQFDYEGRPVAQRQERVPVCVTVPKGRMPAAGWPLMIYIHGTAGVSTQVVDRGVIMEEASTWGEIVGMVGLKGVSEGAEPGTGPALILARRGIAAVGAAQPQNGERGGHPSMIPFYNFFSPEALRDNILQAVAEAVLLRRVMSALRIAPGLCPETDASLGEAGQIYFDPEFVFAMGQSLGSIILGPYGAVETGVKALIPSGAGAHWGLFMAAGNAFDMKSLKEKGEGLTEQVNMDVFHPFISLMQTALAPADPAAYLRYPILEPLPGRKPKNIWLSYGQFDHYFPPSAQAAIITGLGLDLVGEVNDGHVLEYLGLAGREVKGYPVAGNITVNGESVTGVAVQLEQYGGVDGHHINFQRADAKYMYGCFLYSLIHEGQAVLYAPVERWDAPCGPER